MYISDIYFELKDGRRALLRSPKKEDTQGALDFLYIVAGETDFLMSYPEECRKYTAESEWNYLEQKNISENEAMLVCIVEGRLVGNCEISFQQNLKTKHRASVALGIIREFWNQGIGTRMLQELIRLSQSREDVLQVELDFIEGNNRARYLYEKMGFRITGIRPNAVRLKDGTLLNEYMMMKEIKK
ncbi:MAG: GNAT family N-acetyltransferase [Lachnospiraceae bacterium]|nr:GNAT family N-acetyltransferase [Lachnospiraceae bacterium]